MNAFDELCRALGLTWRYIDGAGLEQCAPDASRLAVLRAMGIDIDTPAQSAEVLSALPAPPRWQVLEPGTTAPVPARGDWELLLEDGSRISAADAPAPPPLPMGIHRLCLSDHVQTLLVAPPHLSMPDRQWGVVAPLYGLWQGRRAGPGSYVQLGELAAGLAQSGAAFLGLNPVHAGFPTAPEAFSPYAPAHRRWWNVLHVDAGGDFADTGDLVDYTQDVPAQRAALQARFVQFDHDPEFDRWRAEAGAGIEDFATHQALSDIYGPWWPDWPEALRHPRSGLVRDFAQQEARAVSFHAWCQWQAERQLGAAQARARASGMAFGLYLDLAVGTHPAGAETWAEPDLFVRNVSLGAPPDLLGPAGQCWNLAPLHPRALAETGFAVLAETLRQQLRFAKLLRIDHILGFDRAFWVPDGLPGLYVAMPRTALLAVARIEAARAGATLIGEDLGTIPPGLRDALSDSGILGCRVAMFERDRDPGSYHPARAYARTVLTSWTTHDLPTWAGWRQGRDIDWRAQIGDTPPQRLDQARELRAAEVAGFDAVAGTCDGDPVAMHAFLASTPSALVALVAEDLCGCVEQPNLPGTIDAHPNWRRRLPLPLDRLASSPTLRESAAMFTDADQPEQEP